jgi:hypothetical protein
MRWLLVLLLAGCAVEAPVASIIDAGPPVECRGSKAPAAPLIDPDNPQFSDETFSNAEVRDKFLRAKNDNTAAYRAYKAALANADVLSCGFCKCGCTSLGHVSAIDCFKDMHGFT